MGPKSEAVTIGESRFTVAQLPADRAFRLWGTVRRAVPELLGVFGAAREGVTDEQLALTCLAWSGSGDDLDAIRMELFGAITVVYGGKVGPLLERLELVLGGDFLGMMTLFVVAIRVNYGSFLDAQRAQLARVAMERSGSKDSTT